MSFEYIYIFKYQSFGPTKIQEIVAKALTGSCHAILQLATNQSVLAMTTVRAS